MKDILIYALGVIVCSGLFVLFYRTVLHRRTSFLWARLYLVASLVVAAVIPALDIPVWKVAPVEIPLVAQTVELPVLASPESAAVRTVLPPDWLQIALWALYGLGIAVLALVMARQFFRIARIRKHAELFRTDECEIAFSEEVGAPFSFLSTVFVERGTPDDEMRQILLHEASHIRHRHSHEKITMEVFKNLLWFNPFAWWAARLLSEVHEFEADRDVLDGGFTVEEYLPLIFRQIFGYNPELSVGLGDSLTKKRFLMMKNKMKLTRYSWLRMTGVLPLAAGMLLLFSFTSRPPEIIYTEAPEAITLYAHSDTPMGVVGDVRRQLREDGVTEIHYASDRSLNESEMIVSPVPEPAAQEPQNVEDIPIFNAEVMPKFQGGGINDFRNWVQSRLAYPKEAMENNISGKVNLKFVIERDGSLTSVEEIASPSKLLTNEAIRALKDSPKWTPGTQKGKPVRVFYIIQLEFKLEGDNGPIEPIATAEPAEKSMTKEITVVGFGTLKTPAAAQNPQNPEKTEDIPLFNAEIMPTFQGGDINNFRNWVLPRLVYPKAAFENGIQGTVTLKFVIERDGSLSNIELLSSPDKLLADEAVRVINDSPKWMPGTQKGKPVRVFYILPVMFRIQESEPVETAANEIEVIVFENTKKTGTLKGILSSVRIDGKTTEEAHPMYVMDGLEITQSQLNSVKAAIIESIAVMKDASAVAMFGERAKYGVILITTKDASKPDKELQTGYGTVSENNNTTAISQLDMKGSYAYSDLKTYIQGRVSGVRFMGDVMTVRGINSINSKIEPLILVDGIDVGSFSNANATISPHDVASISVLKDGGATGIYGVRGAGGVVIITTKKGENN